MLLRRVSDRYTAELSTPEEPVDPEDAPEDSMALADVPEEPVDSEVVSKDLIDLEEDSKEPIENE